MHDGSMQTLWDVMDHYNKGGEANPYLDGGIEPLALSEDEIDAVVAFMFALTDERFAERERAATFDDAAQRRRASSGRSATTRWPRARCLPFESARHRQAAGRTREDDDDRRKSSRASRRVTTRSATRFFRGLARLDRRDFLKVSAAAVAAARGQAASASRSDVVHARSASPTRAHGGGAGLPHRLHLRLAPLRTHAQRPLRPQPAARGRRRERAWTRSPTSCSTAATWRSSARPSELELGAQILKNVKAPVRMMVGEHDWYLDMGEKWRELFGEPTYSFDHKGVHFVVLQQRRREGLLDRARHDAGWSA